MRKVRQRKLDVSKLVMIFFSLKFKDIFSCMFSQKLGNNYCTVILSAIICSV